MKADNDVDLEIHLMPVPKEIDIDRTRAHYQRDFGAHSTDLSLLTNKKVRSYLQKLLTLTTPS